MIYLKITARYKILSMDPERFPILQKEAELDACKLEIGVQETTEAVCSRLEPLLESIQKSIPTEQLPARPLRPNPQQEVEISEPEKNSVSRFVHAAMYLSGGLCVLAGAFFFYNKPDPRPISVNPAIVERIPSTIHFKQEAGKNFAWEGTGDPESNIGRWVQITFEQHPGDTADK